MDPTELHRKLLALDERAWSYFVEAYAGVVTAVGTSAGLSPTARQDLLQNTCLAAARGISSLRNPHRMGSWVYGIAYRQAISMLRREREVPLSDEHATGDSPLFRLETDIQERLERAEAIAGLHDALSLLDRSCRQLLSALYLDPSQPSYVQIAELLHMPVGSIGPNRGRCLRRLKDLLASADSLSNGGSGATTSGSPSRPEAPAGRERTRTQARPERKSRP